MPQYLGWWGGKDRVFLFFFTEDITDIKLCELYLSERSWWIEKSLAGPTRDWAADKQTYSIFPTFYCNLDAGCGFNQGWHRKIGGKQKLCWNWESNNSNNQGVVLCVNWAIMQPSRAKTFIGDPSCSCWIPASIATAWSSKLATCLTPWGLIGEVHWLPIIPIPAPENKSCRTG